MASPGKGRKRKLEFEWSKESEFHRATTVLHQRKQELRRAQEEVDRVERKVNEAKADARDLVLEKAQLQLRKCWNPSRCMLCKKKVKETQEMLMVPDCGCDWHDHDYAYAKGYHAKNYIWVSMVPRDECMVCLFPELMPYTGSLVKRLNFNE